MGTDDQITEEEYDVYFKERAKLNAGALSQSTSYDKYLLTLSGGTFGLTITFLKDIIGSSTPDLKWVLGLAWGSLISSILLTLISFLCSEKAYERQVVILEKIYFNKEKLKDESPNGWSTVTGILNILSGAFFVIGITSLFIFVLYNL